MTAQEIKPALIVGSGLENFNFFDDYVENKVTTAYGDPSSILITGKFGGMEVVILSRHGRKHTIPPTQVNNRANIMALKQAGCTHILATSACGSLREQIQPGHLIFPDQFIDFTRHRPVSFFESFEPGKLNHVAMCDPFDEEMRNILQEKATESNIVYHDKGTVITIEGPRFSTRSESKMFRLWGADIINMSTAPEVILANELKIPYALAALCTDYDAWRENEQGVSWEEVLRVFKQNVAKLSHLLIEVLTRMEQLNTR